MKRIKRLLGVLLSLFLLVTAFAPNVYATESDEAGVTITAEELESAVRLKDNRTEPNEQPAAARYSDGDLVTVIVEMQDAPVLDYFDMATYSEDGETSGEAVSEFLTSEDAQALSEELLDGQQEVVDEIAAYLPNPASVTGGESGIEVKAHWTKVANAMAIRIPYGLVESVAQMEGVKRAYVQHVYDRPETQGDTLDLTQDRYTYSLNMVGVQNAWAKGYTGKGMLVSILDTGIDVLQNKQTGVTYGSHEVFTDKSFLSGDPTDADNGWNLRYNEESMAEFVAKKENQMNASTSLVDGTLITYNDSVLYKNLKVPFGFDYADWDVHTRPKDSDHGIHVAGTIAGFAADSEGVVKFSGVAPDAQILAMKVFPDEDGGAEEISIVCALEDSMVLGADVINLSLGSDNGFADDDTMQNDIFARVENAGVVMMTSAGNSDDSVDANNNYEGENLASNPDTSMISSPAVYASNLAVASIDNGIDVQNFMTYTIDGEAHEAAFSDTMGMMADRFSDAEYPIYAVGGFGEYNDFSAAGFDNGWNGGKTGIALVKRGSITFSDKLSFASQFHGVNYRGEEYGVLACIIYDQDPESDALINMSVSGSMVSCFISGRDGKAIADAIEAGKNVTIRTSSEPRTVEMKTAGQMSEFSSWGAGSGLELKPEITAPGGNIWSSVKANNVGDDYTGSYQMMSGTSMAAPHMSGIGALVRQRIVEDPAFEKVKAEDYADVITRLLMSTANPVKNPDGVYYSPRLQGAGLVNADAAVSTPVYISVDGCNGGKLELGDDVNKNGTYPINFNLTNVSENDVTYDVSVVLMRPDAYTSETDWGERTMVADSDVVIKTVSLGSVTATAGTTTGFSTEASLSAEEKSTLDSLFENGVFVEGFVILTDTAGEQVDLGLPMLAYYGDWTAAPIFDAGTWLEAQDGEDNRNNEVTWDNSRVGSVLYDYNGNAIGFYDLAENVFADEGYVQTLFHKENIELSPNGDGYFDQIDDFILYQLRDARAVVVDVADADDDTLYYHQVCTYMTRTTFDQSGGYAMPMSLYYQMNWDGTDMEGEKLPSGTKCVMTITAYGDGDYSAAGEVFDEYYEMDVTNYDKIGPREGYVQPTFNGHAMDMTGDVISFPITVDTVAPKLEHSAVSITEEDGHTYMSGTVNDEDGSLASLQIVPIVKRSYKSGYGDSSYGEYGMDVLNPFLQENIYDAGTKTRTFKVDVTDYAHTNTSYPGENNYYNYEWEGNVVLSCGDYGANDRSYAIKVDSTPGLVLSQTSALLHPGDKFELSVNDNTGTDTEITRTSSDTSVATIDEFGNVVAIAPGQAIITVSDGTYSAICIVAVEAWPEEVLDFRLSIDNMEGLKTDGQATVKVVDLYPADVVVDSISWEVSEDENYANEYAAGLISVEKASADAMTGSLYLTVAASEEELPAGHAVLTVTINGVSRSMDISWDTIPTQQNQDGLKSSALYDEQVFYTTVGEPVNIGARYVVSSEHEFGDVIFKCDNDGLVLDGPMFFSVGGRYSAKLVNKEGFALPNDIKIYTVYSEDSEYQSYPGYSGISYNASTGEINIPYAPYGATNKLRIEAEGVVSDGNPAGTTSGTTYETPDHLYGPFDWTLSDSVNATLKPVNVESSGTTHEEMEFTSTKDGVYYVTASSKDGKYNVKFAVVVEPVRANKIVLESHDMDVACNSTKQATATLEPEPSVSDRADYGKLEWKSFNEDVATVDENGVITGVSLGKAYIKVATVADTKVSNYLIVNVTQGVRFVDDNDEVIKESSKTPDELTETDYPNPPVKKGYKFVEWVSSEDPKTGLTTYKATYEILSYKVTFTADGKTVATIEKEFGSTLSETDYPAVPSKEGYTGIWEVNNFPIESDIELKAKYTALPVEVKNGWLKEDNTWYFYNAGVKKTGWLLDEGTWYYLDKNGDMHVGWLEDRGNWYFFYGNGAMATGWTKLGDTWYYMYDSGAMATGWVKTGNDWYYLYDNGAMAIGWVNDGGTWYYMYANGAMAADHWAGNYYLQKDGSMATNKWIGQWYVGADGAWVKGKKR